MNAEKLLNHQVASEALYSATYVENYLDSVENLPDDVQRHLSRIREIDVQYRAHLRDVDYYYEQWASCTSNEPDNSVSQASTKRNRSMSRIQQSLISAQELGDEKLQIVNQLQELIDHKTRQLENDFQNLDYGKDETHQLSDPHSKDNLLSSSLSANNNNASNYNSYSNSSSAMPSPIHTSSSATATFNTNQPGHTAGSTMTSMSAAPSMPGTSTERYTISATSSGNGGSKDSERLSKRPRRARNDTVSGISGDAAGSGDNSTAPSDTPHKSSMSTMISLATSAVVTPTLIQKKGNASGGGSAASSGTSSGQLPASVVAATASGASGRKKKQRKSGRAGQTGVTAAGATAAGSQAALLNAASVRDHDDNPPPEETIDPDEPTYCLCDQISFGEMILCDNDLCPIEWFHFSCVSLLSKPKGKWFCPNCRGDRPNVMKPKAQFLKELERYNKEKEEKT